MCACPCLTKTSAGVGWLRNPRLLAEYPYAPLKNTPIRSPTETGRRLTFQVTETQKYSMDQANNPEVLERVYETGPVLGTPPQPSSDGLAHLTLITCAGNWVGNGFDHRFVVFAQLVGHDS
jgi:hypothetical protein